MSEFVLPTTAGSVIAFDGWEDQAETISLRYVIALVPGGYNLKTGEFTNAVWMDAYGFQDGGIYDISEATILAGNPEVLFEASEAKFVPVDSDDIDTDDERLYGSIILLDSPVYGENTVAVFTPGALDLTHETIIEGEWMNSSGAYFSQSNVEKEITALLVKGAEEEI